MALLGLTALNTGGTIAVPGSIGVAGSGKNWKRQDKLWKPFIFSFGSSQADSVWITLFINPEEFTQTDPGRVTITQTKGGAFVDHFGKGLVTITIRGITGFGNRKVGNQEISGHQHFLDLRNMFRDWWEKNGNEEKVDLYFLNLADGETWQVVSGAVNLTRSNSRPLLYQYNIQMTCVRKIPEKTEEAHPSWTGWEDFIKNPSGRPPLVYTRLNQELGFIGSLLNRTIDVSKFSTGTQAWLGYVNKGREYFDSATKSYRTIENVVSDVEQLSKDVGMFVSGVTSFIVKPFEIVRDIAIALGDVASEMCSVTDIPHELVRSFREIQCAVRVLPEKIFKGFTNPYLFEGESNCGTSLGILESAVFGYDNSFTATAQIAPERSISQIFISPQIKMTLKEEPISVVGVYLETDNSRLGNNYLESWSGKTITLTSIPTQPIVVDYKVLQDTAINKITLQASKSRVIKDGDTMERMALVEYQDPTRWKEIALFNGLEYPFIVASDFSKEQKATGYVRFYRDPSYVSAITIADDTPVWVPMYQGTEQIDFIVSQTTTVPISATYVDVPVEAVLSGSIGNVAPSRITGFNPIIGILKINNLFGTTGGKFWNVMTPGNIIQIPSSESTVSSTITGATQSYEELFGKDLFLNEDGELESGTETDPDIGRVFGIGNLVQALRNKIATSKGFYIYHSDYGSNLPYYIGKKNVPYWEDVLASDIKNVCLTDPRITKIEEFTMEVNGDKVIIDFDAMPINENAALTINLIV